MRLVEFITHPERAQSIPREELPELFAELRRLEVMLQLRLNGHPKTQPTEPEDEKWLNAKEAAEKLHMSTRWLYRHAAKLPFARRVSRKKLLFSESGLNRWLAKNKV